MSQLKDYSYNTLSKIDRLVAKEVLGWRDDVDTISWVDASGKRLDFDHSVYGSEPDFRPTVDINAAWEVIYKFSWFSLENNGKHDWVLRGELNNKHVVVSATIAQLAICLAALQAFDLDYAQTLQA